MCLLGPIAHFLRDSPLPHTLDSIGRRASVEQTFNAKPGPTATAQPLHCCIPSCPVTPFAHSIGIVPGDRFVAPIPHSATKGGTICLVLQVHPVFKQVARLFL